MKFKIEPNSTVPLYRQVISLVTNGIRSGALKNGDALPSLNEFAATTGISMETAKKAYYILKRNGLISGRQGKGFYVDVRDNGAPKRVLMLLDKLSAYKLEIHSGFMESIGIPCDVTINIHNQDIGLFERIVEDAADAYDYFIVAAHFQHDVPTAAVVKILRHIQRGKLILIDRELPEAKGNIGRVYQDFRNDAVTALSEEMDLIGKYDRVNIISSGKSLYGGIISPSIRKMLAEKGVKCRAVTNYEPSMMVPGTLFIVLCGQLDNDHFTILREASARGYTLGKAIGLVTYNDEPVNEFICGGLTCISSDFRQMGCAAAEMVRTGEMRSVHNPFRMIKRSSL